MTIVKLFFKIRAIRFWAFVLVMAALLISIGTRFDLNKSEWSGWAQAVGAFVAIMASGWIASAQAKQQYQDARRLQHIDHAHQAFRMAKASNSIAARVGRLLMLVIREFNWDRSTFMDIADGTRPFDRNFLLEMRADLEAIQLHELLSSRLIDELMLMRSVVRQVIERIDIALGVHRQMDAAAYIEFFNMLDRAHLALCGNILEIEQITRSIQVEIAQLKN